MRRLGDSLVVDALAEVEQVAEPPALLARPHDGVGRELRPHPLMRGEAEHDPAFGDR